MIFFFSLQRYGEAQIGLLSEPFNNGMLKAEDVKVENTRSSFYITHLSTDFSVLIFRLNLTQSLSIWDDDPFTKPGLLKIRLKYGGTHRYIYGIPIEKDIMGLHQFYYLYLLRNVSRVPFYLSEEWNMADNCPRLLSALGVSLDGLFEI